MTVRGSGLSSTALPSASAGRHRADAEDQRHVERRDDPDHADRHLLRRATGAAPRWRGSTRAARTAARTPRSTRPPSRAGRIRRAAGSRRPRGCSSRRSRRRTAPRAGRPCAARPRGPDAAAPPIPSARDAAPSAARATSAASAMPTIARVSPVAGSIEGISPPPPTTHSPSMKILPANTAGSIRVCSVSVTVLMVFSLVVESEGWNASLRPGCRATSAAPGDRRCCSTSRAG